VADDLANYPIVVLENDYPEQVGKMGLFDLLMPVGATGLIFTAAMPGILREWGPSFSDEVHRVSNLRAASTLIQMGLIRAESVVFIRESLRMSQQEMATLYGVTVETVMGWEDKSIPIPLNVWTCLSYRVCLADGRTLPPDHALCPDWRARLIRVFPNAPMPGNTQPDQPSLCPQPPSGFPGADCYPPPRC
jgi:DNA-binding XRE family transcriptional regulator